MSQAPTLCKNVPMSETTLAISRLRNVSARSSRHKLRAAASSGMRSLRQKQQRSCVGTQQMRGRRSCEPAIHIGLIAREQQSFELFFNLCLRIAPRGGQGVERLDLVGREVERISGTGGEIAL